MSESAPRRWCPALVLLLYLLALLSHARFIKPGEPLTRDTDTDAIDKLGGIAEDPSLGAALSWFWGDDPQQVHSFRPLAALTLWVEYRLWGWARLGYQLMNLVYLLLCAIALGRLAGTLGLPPPGAHLAALLFLAIPTRGSRALVYYIATRSDLLCGLFAAIALTALIRYLTDERPIWPYLVASLAAYLCKEHAVFLLPLSIVVVLLVGRETARRRRLAAVGAAFALTLVWFGWLRLAERNMVGALHPGHSPEDFMSLVVTRGGLFRYAIFNLYGPLGDVVAPLFFGTWGSLLLQYYHLALLWCALAAAGCRLLWRRNRRLLLVVVAWKLTAYLPVLPFRDLYPWYSFIPHLTDMIFPAALVWYLTDQRQAQRRRQRERALAEG